MKSLASRYALALNAILLSLFTPAARAEVPFDPPGTYSTSWLGNTYMDAAGHKNVTEELADLCLSPNGKIFTAGYADLTSASAARSLGYELQVVQAAAAPRRR